jgi:hypothetical protein
MCKPTRNAAARIRPADVLRSDQRAAAPFDATNPAEIRSAGHWQAEAARNGMRRIGLDMHAAR